MFRPERGDIVGRRCGLNKSSDGWLHHYAVYVGPQEGIQHDLVLIEFNSSADSSKQKIQRAPIGNHYWQTVHRKKSRAEAVAVVARAERRLGEEGYNIVFNNCECFVRWCYEGSNYSRQGTAGYAATGTVATGIAVAAGFSTGTVAASGVWVFI